jgi:hypothetical protein
MPRYTAIGYAGGSRKVSQHLKTLNRYDLHDSLMKDTLQLMSVCGFKSVYDITLSNFLGKLDVLHSNSFEIQNGRVLHLNARKKTPVPR